MNEEENKQPRFPLTPFESHYWQAIYDFEGKDAVTQMDTALNEVDFNRIKSFALFPIAKQPLQTALVLDYMLGYKLIFRREGSLNMVPSQDKPGMLVVQQKAYTYILGLVEDDGSDELEKIEKGEIGSLKKVDFRGGFRIIMTPDGRLNAVGAYDVHEAVEEVAGQKVQFLHFAIKLET